MKHFVNVVIPPLAEPLSYTIPTSESSIDVGHRVVVPLGNRLLTGYVVSIVKEIKLKSKPKESSQLSLSAELEQDNSVKVKSIILSDQNNRCFMPEHLSFFQKVGDYYCAPLSSVIDVAIPGSVKEKLKKKVRLLNQNPSPELVKRSKKAQDVINILNANNLTFDLEELKRLVKGVGPVLKRLSEQGILIIEDGAPTTTKLFDENIAGWAPTAVDLNRQQINSLNKINSATDLNKFETFLLHGVTGSGKTEVYIEAAAHTIALGKSVIIIVPEIALTPQLIDRFRARLGDNIASLHSGLSKKARWQSWKALLEGRCKIAIGARSAIFAPLIDVGLIVVDEEHDSSYKQSDGLRYNARDMAILKAQMSKCPVVLGSATPSLESYYKARTGKFTLLRLDSRYSTAPPLNIEVVDLRNIKPWQMHSPNISNKLLKAIENTVAKHEQVFILYNRRGFASFLQCDSCGNSIQCPNCSVAFTYHQYKNSLLCHYCGLTSSLIEYCPGCIKTGEADSAKLIQRGGGTEKIFEEISNLFPDIKIARLDRDTVSSIDSYKEILDQVRSGSTGILVGTQMIAKGHDLPNVTLVGVVDCDVGLHMPDFRAAERNFQLLTQVAGRAGRGDKPGQVILQTRMPFHPSISETLSQDYINFAKIELTKRRDLEYPPFVRLLRIVAGSSEEQLLKPCLIDFRARAEEFIKAHGLGIKILGPAPAPLLKLKALWRWHILFKSQSVSSLNKLLLYLQSTSTRDKRIRVAFDVDPREML